MKTRRLRLKSLKRQLLSKSKNKQTNKQLQAARVLAANEFYVEFLKL